MGTVYGPFDVAEWYTMLALRTDEKFMRRIDPVKYDIAIRWTRGKLKDDYYSRQTAA